MYDRIARELNKNYGSIDISAEDVENYLRHGDTTYISADEMIQIDVLVERFL